MKKASWMDMDRKYILFMIAVICFAGICMGCGKVDDGQEESTGIQIKSGDVESAEDMTQIGVYLDVDKNSSEITDVKYKISGDIGIMSFRYSGVKVELRGSCKYEMYDLAGVENTSNGDMITGNIQGYSATYYTLTPGRIAFWSDGTINYSLYIYVTASDEVLNEVLSHIVFENRYTDRADVQQQIETDSRAFAEKIVKVFNDEDLETMKDMVLYPQETSGGQSIANENELLNVDKKALFTDILMKALNDENALENLRKTNDGSEYVIGTNYKNVHFRLNDDGQFVITKINN